MNLREVAYLIKIGVPDVKKKTSLLFLFCTHLPDHLKETPSMISTIVVHIDERSEG